MWDSAIVPCFVVHSSFAIISMGNFALFVYLVSRDCCVAHPHDATGLNVVCDCGISRSYSHESLVRIAYAQKPPLNRPY